MLLKGCLSLFTAAYFLYFWRPKLVIGLRLFRKEVANGPVILPGLVMRLFWNRLSAVQIVLISF